MATNAKKFPTTSLLEGRDGRLYDDHDELVGGWNEEQLASDAETVWKPLSPGVTRKQLYAIASIARSVWYSECHHPGQGCHYSRNRNNYVKRYNGLGYELTTSAAGVLESLGCIEQVIPEKSQWGGKQSVAYSTPQLMILLSHRDPDEPPAAVPETVILRGKGTAHRPGKLKAYSDTPETNKLRKQIAVISEELGANEILLDDSPVAFSGIRAIFNQSFDRGGRLYAVGDNSWQGMPKEDRVRLQWKVDGEHHDVVEIDYIALHLARAYVEAGVPMPPGDPYEIDGFDRKPAKTATLTLINAANHPSSLGSVSHETGLPRTDAGHLIAGIKVKHHKIRSIFYSDAGARYQKLDGQMAISVMQMMIDKTGICPLPVHDSFIVPDIYAGLLEEVMKVVALGQGIPDIQVKVNQPTTTHTHPPTHHYCM